MNDVEVLLKDIGKNRSLEAVCQLLNRMGYSTDPVHYEPEELGLSPKVAGLVRETQRLYLNGDFAIYFFRTDSLRRAKIRPIVECLHRKVSQHALHIFTLDFSELAFVSPQVLWNQDKARSKLRLRILQVDTSNPTRTDLDVLSEIRIVHDEAPASAWRKHLEAFQVEKVTKKFFEEYKDHFWKLVSALKKDRNLVNHIIASVGQEKADKELESFAQILLGRLIFIYFLQRKGWLPKTFLRNLFFSSSFSGSAYKDYLAPLFYEAFNKPDKDRQLPAHLSEEFKIIPYLNGGLFEKKIYEPDDLDVSAEIIREILKFLDSYNFTVQEDTPLNVEVGLDPELLGMVFEKMIPEARRHGTGTYYTPRQVVHFMCREALKEYLASFTQESDIKRHQILDLIENEGEEATKSLTQGQALELEALLKEAKILDPAVGSGAFVVGMAEEIARLRKLLARVRGEEVDPRTLKKEIIEENLYGVDIEPEAVEIARLRLWFTLMIDMEKPEPLPNLDYKMMVGNSLVEPWDFIDREDLKKLLTKDQLFLRDDESAKRISNLKRRLYNERSPERRKKLREQIEEAERGMVKGIVDYMIKEYEKALQDESLSSSKVAEIENKINGLKILLKSGVFTYYTHFSEVFGRGSEKGGFDIVIANPPYVCTREVSKLDYRPYLENRYGFVDDLYVHFTFKAFELLRPGGIAAMITSDTYLTLNTKERMRRLLQDKHLLYLALTPKAFEAAVNTAIFVAKNETLESYDFLWLDGRDLSGLRAADDLANQEDIDIFEGIIEHREYDSAHRVRVGNRELRVDYKSDDPLFQYRVPIDLYKNAVGRAFFTPNTLNLHLYKKFMGKVVFLQNEWGKALQSSKHFKKYKDAILAYLETLKPGDITLLGLAAEGGQGLATADNGRFLAVLEGTPEAEKIKARRAQFIERWLKDPKFSEEVSALIKKGVDYAEVIDEMRKRHSDEEMGLPRTFIYKIVPLEKTFDVEQHLGGIKEPAEREKKREEIIFKGLSGERIWVKFLSRVEEPYFQCPEEFIMWDKETVRWIYEHSGKKGNKMPTIRNPDLFFESVFIISSQTKGAIEVCFSDPCIWGISIAIFKGLGPSTSEKYLAATIASSLLNYTIKTFLNNATYSVNDLRLLPIIIPTEEQKKRIEELVDKAIEIQKKRCAALDGSEKDRLWKELELIQQEINREVEKIYGVDMSLEGKK